MARKKTKKTTAGKRTSKKAPPWGYRKGTKIPRKKPGRKKA